MRHPRFIELTAMGIVVALAGNCEIPELCTPQEGTVGFFSQGDCVFTKASELRGHEWLTFLANRDLPESSRFPPGEIADIIEGNRRVDWPKELLVHMAHSVVSYIQATNELQDRPENQPQHFLLGADNDSQDAVARAQDVVRARTHRAAEDWTDDRVAALTRLGEACHTIQDSFSFAHSVRAGDDVAMPWCVRAVKTYIARAPGFELSGDLYHGGKSGDTIGHTTTRDSLYRTGRDCNDPASAEHVESCLSSEARRARLATHDYLSMASDLMRGAAADERTIDRAVDTFFAAHMALCP